MAQPRVGSVEPPCLGETKIHIQKCVYIYIYIYVCVCVCVCEKCFVQCYKADHITKC